MTASRIYGALAALLFLALSAWTGAALYARLTPPPPAAEEESPAAEAPARLRGVVLRREQVLSETQVPPGARDGARLSARETGGESALFFSDSDGYEALAPEDAEGLTPAGLDALLAVSPRKSGAARLVTGRAFYYAAFLEGGGAPAEGDRLRLRFDGWDRPLGARVLSVSSDAAGRRALLLRLTEGEEFLCRVRFAEAEAA